MKVSKYHNLVRVCKVELISIVNKRAGQLLMQYAVECPPENRTGTSGRP